MTTASEVPAPCGAALSTCASNDCPAIWCRTFGSFERIRVPSPAASTTVRLERDDICFLEICGQRFRPRRHKAFSRSGKRCGFKIRPQILLMFPCDSLVISGILLRGMAKDSDQLAGALDADNTGGLLSGLLAEEN